MGCLSEYNRVNEFSFNKGLRIYAFLISGHRAEFINVADLVINGGIAEEKCEFKL